MLEALSGAGRSVPDLEPVSPPIRSSDAKYSCPYMYLLRRRYGLVPPAEYSPALSQGTHWHKLLELETEPDFEKSWDTYSNEVLHGLEGNVLTNVKRDLELCKHTWSVIRSRPCDEKGNTLAHLVRMPHLRLVANELKISMNITGPLQIEYPVTIQIDKLFYHPKQNALYIFDLKSTGSDAQVRAAQCPFEFQTWLYIETLNQFVGIGGYQDLGVPQDTKVAGIQHYIFSKPKIRLSAEDRDYELKTRIFQKGPRKGTTDISRNWYGEPQWSNFVRRWAQQFIDNPERVLCSFTPLLGNEGLLGDFWNRLDWISPLSQCAVDEPIFFRTESGAVDWNAVSPYYPFYVNPRREDWAQIAARHNFRVEHRDPPDTLARINASPYLVEGHIHKEHS